MKGNKQADVHSVFSGRLRQLIAAAAACADGFRRSGQRGWTVPDENDAESLFDVPALHQPGFDREPINVNYEQCFQDEENPGTVGDVIGLKLQVDYVAAEERAYRFRHASTVRCLVHAAGRRMGDSVGPVFRYVEETVGDVIRTGGAE